MFQLLQRRSLKEAFEALVKEGVWATAPTKQDAAIVTGGSVAELRARLVAVLKAEETAIDFVAADFEFFDVDAEFLAPQTFDLAAEEAPSEELVRSRCRQSSVTLSDARSRLYHHQFLQPNTHFFSLFRALQHSSKLQ